MGTKSIAHRFYLMDTAAFDFVLVATCNGHIGAGPACFRAGQIASGQVTRTKMSQLLSKEVDLRSYNYCSSGTFEFTLVSFSIRLLYGIL